jgi:hypothetical protein
MTTLPSAIYSGSLPIGDITIDCAVLEDGTRILAQHAVHRAFGSKVKGGAHAKRIKANNMGADIPNLPSFISAVNLRAFINNDLAKGLISPIFYTFTNGGRPAKGIRAQLLPEICDVYIQAQKEGKLHPTQEHMAAQAEVLMKAFAKVGIVALVDEAKDIDQFKKAIKKQETISIAPYMFDEMNQIIE